MREYCGDIRFMPSSSNFGEEAIQFPSLFYNENHGQWKRYQRHIADVSITPVIINSALQVFLLDN